MAEALGHRGTWQKQGISSVSARALRAAGSESHHNVLLASVFGAHRLFFDCPGGVCWKIGPLSLPNTPPPPPPPPPPPDLASPPASICYAPGDIVFVVGCAGGCNARHPLPRFVRAFAPACASTPPPVPFVGHTARVLRYSFISLPSA